MEGVDWLVTTSQVISVLSAEIPLPVGPAKLGSGKEGQILGEAEASPYLDEIGTTLLNFF